MPTEEGPDVAVISSAHDYSKGIENHARKQASNESSSMILGGTVPNGTHAGGPDLNGDGSEGEPGQQWTEVGRSTGGRYSYKKKLKNMVSGEGVNANGHSDADIIRSRSFRGPRDHTSSNRSYCPNLVVRGRNSFCDPRLVNGYATRHEADKLVQNEQHIPIHIKVDMSEPGLQKSSVPSSPSLSSDPHINAESHDERGFYRPQEKYHRNHRTLNVSPDSGDPQDRNSGRQISSIPYGSVTAVNPVGRTQAGRVTRSPGSQSGLVANQCPVHDEQWRRTTTNWRRPHHSMSFSGRNQLPYRFGAPTPRSYHNASRYRPTTPNAVCLSTPSNPPETLTAAVPIESPPSLTSASVTTSTTTIIPTVAIQTAAPDKKTSWAAAVAATPSRTEQTIPLPTACTDPSCAQLIEFLMNQWKLFRQQI
ncbi:hypothetical protein EG68_02441 [Paragonimus skrjabini miyazakii]|uniref:Uncharacterized protein n=1 Tax=Paragonimus skrjabini miyazakii TaxID=59628 RepID=A0A8S9Z3K7_9TREM|nr:hypothetical protein EG68_02441 [Paragonimus skrjabini miyazakii]